MGLRYYTGDWSHKVGNGVLPLKRLEMGLGLECHTGHEGWDLERTGVPHWKLGGFTLEDGGRGLEPRTGVYTGNWRMDKGS